MLKSHPHVSKLRSRSGIILAKYVEPLHPTVRGESIQRLVIKRRHHLRHCSFGRNGVLERRSVGLAITPFLHHSITPFFHGQRPGLLLSWLQLRNEMLPFKFKFLVFPWHIDVTRFQIATVFVHLGDVQCEAAAHRLGNGHFYLLLCLARFRPISLEHLVPMLYLDKCSPFVIARAPES